MPRRGKAVICRELNKPVLVEEVEFDAPKRGEVAVKIGAVGVCHSDLSATNGTIPMQLPLILGHEAAGEVVELGEGVTELAVGDKVVSNWIYMCGRCHYCTIGRPVLCDLQGKALATLPDGTLRTRDRRGSPLNVFSGCGVMAEYAVVHADNLVQIDPRVAPDRAALVGCAVTTGVGAVFNTARVRPGSIVAVWGCGGVGLNVIQGAVLAGAGRIVAVDVLASKLSYAREFGATDVVDASQGDVVARIQELTNGGADYAFEAIGNSRTILQAYESTCLGGVTTVVGMAPEDDAVTINALSLPRSERVIMGSWYGSARPWLDLPKMVDLYLSGKIKIDPMISRTYSLDEINVAYDALAKGEVARSVILFP